MEKCICYAIPLQQGLLQTNIYSQMVIRRYSNNDNLSLMKSLLETKRVTYAFSRFTGPRDILQKTTVSPVKPRYENLKESTHCSLTGKINNMCKYIDQTFEIK